MKAHKAYVAPVALGLFDAQDRLAQLRAMGDPLTALEAVMDWAIFVPVLERIPRAQNPRPRAAARPTGRC